VRKWMERNEGGEVVRRMTEEGGRELLRRTEKE
jgi:hypothetical protein